MPYRLTRFSILVVEVRVLTRLNFGMLRHIQYYLCIEAACAHIKFSLY